MNDSDREFLDAVAIVMALERFGHPEWHQEVFNRAWRVIQSRGDTAAKLWATEAKETV